MIKPKVGSYWTHKKTGRDYKLAHQLDLDVTECLSIAYEEIKNRKGKMVNGTFVKEEDL